MSTDTDFVPAEAFPPGDFLREELAERGWTQADLADILGKSLPLVNEVITGKREITPATAQALSAALGTSAQFWLNLESTYRLYLESQKRTNDDSGVSRRARLYSKAPVKEMVKRGWIESSSNVEVLERRICDFFEIKKIEDSPSFLPHAARKSVSYDTVNSSLLTWLYRARQLARITPVSGTFGVGKLSVFPALKTLLHAPAETRQVARILSQGGIRLVIVEPISRTRVDGVTFWLDRKSPVVALSLRIDRIDWFWHTLIHELEHVDARDGQQDSLPIVHDYELLKTSEAPEAEKAVSKRAAAKIIDQDELDDFIARTRPLYSKTKIENFAGRLKVHPGIVVGQLQHRKEIDWSHSRNLLAKVREFVVGSTLTDGWGFTPLAL